MNRATSIPCTLFFLSLLASPPRAALAQASAAQSPRPSTARERSDYFLDHSVDREYKLHYTQSAQDANELLTALRNMVEPQTKIFLVPSPGVIAVHAPEDTQAQVAKLLAALDQPHARYRLTYTLTELDGTQKIGVQHFGLVVVSGQRSQLKQGSRVPLLAASSPATKAGDPVAALTYIDVGVNLDSTLTETQNGGMLRTRVEQSSVAPDSMGSNGGNPVIRQTFFEGSVTLVLGKPVLIGSLDVPSSTHHFDVDVVMEPVN